jgi:hypothetical protein
MMSRARYAALHWVGLWVLLCIPCMNSAPAQQPRSAERGPIPEVDPQIHLVLTGGCWHRGELQGSYRLIVVEGGFEELFNIAYVQVTQVDLKHGLETVTKTSPITEVEDGRYLVTLRNVTLARSGGSECGDAVFTGDIVRRTRERLVSKRKFRLLVHSDGSYVWSETATSGSGSQRSDAPRGKDR